MLVLDAWATSALVLHEPSGPAVGEMIRREGARMSWINLGETVTSVHRRYGWRKSEAVVRSLTSIITVELADDRLVLDAARLKARGGISYADCFGVATALRHSEPIVTGDPEIVALHGTDGLEVIDPR